MAESGSLEEGAAAPHSNTMPHRLSVAAIRQPSGVLMTHTAQVQQSPMTTVNLGGLNFAGRTAEHSRIIADNITTAIEEIRPLFEQARSIRNSSQQSPNISLTSWLNLQRSQQATPAPAADSYVINLEEQPSTSQQAPRDHRNHYQHHHHTTATDNFLNNIREAANAESQNNNNNNNNNNTEEGSTDALRISPEARAFLEVLQKYVPFVIILVAKCFYDRRVEIFNFLALLVTFIHANNVLKREIAKQHNRSRMSLLVILFYIVGCIVFIAMFEEHRLYLSLVLIPPYTQPITVWELLWTVAITDFILKLITIVLKVVLTCLPVRIMAFQKRGKYYLMVEATSQLYRSVAAIQPWLYYLLEAYQGPEKVLGVFLSAAYMVSKGSDLVSCGKLFRTAAWKLLQNVNLGVCPSKEQLIASGGICAICHEEYSIPVRLHCKHIFCETCVSTWLDRERSCPLCRASITDDPVFRDGHTTYFIQIY